MNKHVVADSRYNDRFGDDNGETRPEIDPDRLRKARDAAYKALEASGGAEFIFLDNSVHFHDSYLNGRIYRTEEFVTYVFQEYDLLSSDA